MLEDPVIRGTTRECKHRRTEPRIVYSKIVETSGGAFTKATKGANQARKADWMYEKRMAARRP